MADNNHQMKVGLGYNVDLTALQEIVNITTQINTATQGAAKGLKEISKAANGASSASSSWLNTQKKMYDADLTTYEDYKKKLIAKNRQLYTELTSIKAKEKGTESAEYTKILNEYAAVHKEMTNITKAEAKQQADIVKQNLKEITNQYNQSISTFKSLGKEINRTFNSSRSLGESILNSMITYGAIRQITNEFQNLGTAISEINYNTINNQRLMGDFSTELSDALNSSAAEIAKNTGIAITDAQKIQGAWIRIKDEYAESVELLNEISGLTAKFMNVGEIEDAESAVILLNASLLQFNISTDEAVRKSEEFLNKWAYMADVTAMGTADEYGEAISKYGANINALNGSMDDAIALSSVMADRLAKGGEEAGTALKTFTAYMNRDKTRSLFATIAQDLGDTSFNLTDANGRMLDFNENLRKIAEAYQIYKSQGNDVMAQDILNAVGATRQRDTAMAILNAVNDGAYDEYLGKLTDPDVNGYIEEQNEALMTALVNQWNSLVVALQEAGSKIADSGLIQVSTVLMNGLEGLISVVGKIPTPVMMAANAFITLKTGMAGLNKIGEITGLTNSLWKSLKIGTKEQIENAASTQAIVTSLLDREKASMAVQKASLGETKAYQMQASALANFSSGCEQAAISYKNGSINAVEYSDALNNLKAQYVANTNQIRNNVSAENDKIAANRLSTITTKNAENAEKAANITKKETLVQLAKEKIAQIANNGLKKIGIQTTVQDTAAKHANTIASIAAAGAMTLLGTAIQLVTSPMFLLTAGFTLLTSLWQQADIKAQDLATEISDLNSQLDETKSRIEELNKLESSTGLTQNERDELEYLQQKVTLLEQAVKLKQQEKNNAEWEDTGGFLGWGSSENSKESLDNLIESYENAESRAKAYSKALEGVEAGSEDATTYNKYLQEANEDLRSSAGDLATEYYRLKEAYDQDLFSGEAKKQVGEYLEKIEPMLSTIETLTKEYQDLSDTIASVSEETEAYIEDMDGLKDKVEDLNDLFEEYNKEGYLSYETVAKLVAEHPEYVKYLVKVGDQYKLNKVAENELNQANEDLIKTTDELIAKLNEEQEVGQNLSQEMIDAVDAVDYYTVGIRNTFGNIEGINEFCDNLRTINTELLQGKSSIGEYNTQMNELTNGLDFSKVNDDLSNLDASAKEMAQSQQAVFTSLTQEVSNYMQEITNALYEGEMSVTDYVTALQGSNENLLDMYTMSNDLIYENDTWIDAATGQLDAYANNLQAAIDKMYGMGEVANYVSSCYEQMSLAAENNAAIVQENGQIKVDTEWWASTEGQNAANAMRDNFVATMSDLATNNAAAYNDIVRQTAEATGYTRDEVIAMLNDNSANSQLAASVVGAGTTAMMAQVGSAADTATSAAGDVFTALGNLIDNFDYTLDFGVSGSISPGGNILDLAMGKSFKPTSNLKLKITGSGGTSIETFTNSLRTLGNSLNTLAIDNFLSSIEAYNPVRSGYTGGNIASNYKPTSSGSGSSADRNTPATRTPTGSSSGSSGKSSAEKAADEAAKAAEEAAKAIEKLINEYVKNVESMYDRIAKALKKKYQEQYDERKKILEKEHEARVAQIQAEIDAINGERPEDKQSELSNLQSQYQKWLADDSTLGKAKQKDYLDQIEELKKEIKLDELEKKLDEENENYENSIDSDSEFYDAILKKLDQQMTDEALYREAADLIRNEKTQEIIDLLTEYDAQWDGWATLMGQTAGEIIAKEVALAIANYKDVKDGTVTENGGVNTNKVNGVTTTTSSASTGSTSTSSSGSTRYHTVKSGDTLWDLAVKYYGDGTKWTKIQNANGGINPYTLTIGKKLIIPFFTGGYTGMSEGIAYLHKKERVLSAQQTSAFETLVYDFLPTIQKELLHPAGDSNTINNNNNGNTFNKELVSVHVDKVINNTPHDIKNSEDNLDRMFRQSLRKSGINIKK